MSVTCELDAQQVARSDEASASWLLRKEAGKRPAASARRSATPLGKPVVSRVRDWRLMSILVVLALVVCAVSLSSGSGPKESSSLGGGAAGASDRDVLAADALRVFALSDSGGIHRTQLSDQRVILVHTDVYIQYRADSLGYRDSLSVAALPISDGPYFVLKSGPELQRRRLFGPVDYIRIQFIDIISPVEAAVEILVCHMPAGQGGYLASDEGDRLRFRREGPTWKYVGVDCIIES
jgi:hypothetical protein